MVIAIDGPGGVGKSTVARRVAEALRLPYLDTGSTYRAATLAVLRAEVDPANEDAVEAVVESAAIGYETDRPYLGEEEVGSGARSPEVTAAVSAVSAHRRVRRNIVALQQRWVSDHGGEAVVEGRDIGTVVFPEAPVKVFLTARPEVRAARRAGDSEAGGRDLSHIADELAARDHADSTREASPLQQADDAVVLDTSVLSNHEVVARILALAAVAGYREGGDRSSP